jgi:hypothetical protein
VLFRYFNELFKFFSVDRFFFLQQCGQFFQGIAVLADDSVPIKRAVSPLLDLAVVL